MKLLNEYEKSLKISFSKKLILGVLFALALAISTASALAVDYSEYNAKIPQPVLNNYIANGEEIPYEVLLMFGIVEPESKLVLSDLDIETSSGTDKNVHNEADGYVIGKQAAPGSQITITFQLENKFTDSEDLRIEDIEVIVTLDEIGDEEEQEETVEIDYIKPEKESSSESVTFDIPEQMDEGQYTLTIEAEGEDEDRVKHSFTRTFKIEVEKENYAVKLDIDLSPETITGSGTARLEVELANIGAKDLKDLDVVVKNTVLGIDLSKSIDKLESDWDDSDNDETLVFNIDIDDADAGFYALQIDVYRNDGDEKLASDSVTLNIRQSSSGKASDEAKDVSEISKEAIEILTDYQYVQDIPEKSNTLLTALAVLAIVFAAEVVIFGIAFALRK